MNLALLVDHRPVAARFTGRLLESCGYRVVLVPSLERAVEEARRHVPGVVLCYADLARAEKFPVLRRLRQLLGSHGRVLLLLPAPSRGAAAAAPPAGADDVLREPLTREKLLAALPPVTAGESGLPARLRFWGVRGSIPTPGRSTVRYGGNTSCVEVRAGPEILILDAGTGLRMLGRHLREEFGDRPLSLTILLTHTHWDHIQGLPFFAPLYEPRHRVRILGCKGARRGLRTVLNHQMESPFFPVGLPDLPANVTIEEFPGSTFTLGPVRVTVTRANHPGLCVGYRLTVGNRSLVYLPDNEPHGRKHRLQRHSGAPPSHDTAFVEQADAQLTEFCRGAEVLILDAQYDCQEYQQRVGWGHGCVDDAVGLALAAGVRRLFLFHHDPDHDDAQIDALTAHARALVKAQGGRLHVAAAREGRELVWAPAAGLR